MVKKGQSIAINTIIILIIALVALIFVVLFFTGTFSKGMTGTNNVLNPTLNQTNQTGQAINNIPNQVNGGPSLSSTSTSSTSTTTTININGPTPE
ncbi:MAG: hypothetical protein RXN31_01405 [Candidatus Nanopusillus acidilobi]